MKKILLLVFIVALAFISCKSKAKPTIGDENNIGKGPEEVDLGGNFNTLNNAIDQIADNFAAEKGDWVATQTEKILNNLKGGYIVIRDQDSTFWTILGITDNENIQVGIADFNNGQNALTAAANSKNFDPRKLIFREDGTGNIKIAWAGRAGTSSSTPGKAVDPYTGYDAAYGHILQGVDKTFKVLGDYAVVGFPGVVVVDGKSTWPDTTVVIQEKGDLPIPAGRYVESYVYEKIPTGGKRKAWFWWGDWSFVTSGNVRVLYKKGIRFGYGTTDTDYPSITGAKKGGSTLKKLNVTATDDNSEPAGKVMFFRGNVHFFTTMVGYDLRTRTPKNAALLALEGVKIKDIKEGIMEFDDGSFQDANADGFVHVTDAPTSKITDKSPLVSGNDTIKVPFIFFRPL